MQLPISVQNQKVPANFYSIFAKPWRQLGQRLGECWKRLVFCPKGLLGARGWEKQRRRTQGPLINRLKYES